MPFALQQPERLLDPCLTAKSGGQGVAVSATAQHWQGALRGGTGGCPFARPASTLCAFEGLQPLPAWRPRGIPVDVGSNWDRWVLAAGAAALVCPP